MSYRWFHILFLTQPKRNIFCLIKIAYKIVLNRWVIFIKDVQCAIKYMHVLTCAHTHTH